MKDDVPQMLRGFIPVMMQLDDHKISHVGPNSMLLRRKAILKNLELILSPTKNSCESVLLNSRSGLLDYEHPPICNMVPGHKTLHEPHHLYTNRYMFPVRT